MRKSLSSRIIRQIALDPAKARNSDELVRKAVTLTYSRAIGDVRRIMRVSLRKKTTFRRVINDFADRLDLLEEKAGGMDG